MQFRDVSAEVKLQWLEEAVAFVNRFVSAEKRERWRRFIASLPMVARNDRGGGCALQ